MVEGVEERERWRSSFRYRKEPGEIRLAIEVVSKSSLKKDYKDILEIYNRMEVEEYIVIHPVGLYETGPFELRGWRRDPQTQRLCPFPPDQEGRLHTQTTGTLLGTEAEGYSLQVWNAQTGKLLRTANEERAMQAEKRADQEKKHADQEKNRADQAEKRAEQAEKARTAAEAEMAKEIDRLQAQFQDLQRGLPRAIV